MRTTKESRSDDLLWADEVTADIKDTTSNAATLHARQHTDFDKILNDFNDTDSNDVSNI